MSWITDTFGLSSSAQSKIAGSVIVIASLLVVRWLVLRAIRRIADDEDVVYRSRKVTAYIVTFVSLVTMGFIWLEAFNNFGTYLGLLSAGLAIALSDLLKNIAGWAYLVIRRPFRVGDRIEFQETRGDVVDVRLFRFSVVEIGNWVHADQSTGRLIHIPNGLLFTNAVANYTEGFPYVWDEIEVLVTFESDWRRAEQMVLAAVHQQVPDLSERAADEIRETAHRYQIKLGALTPIVYVSVRDSGVLLTARYLSAARARRGNEERVWRAILDRINSDPTVELAYPTVRTYFSGPIALSTEPIADLGPDTTRPGEPNAV